MASDGSATAVALLESAFLVLVYGFVMFRGSKLVNEARQSLLEVFTPGVTSGVVLTLVSALPTAIVIITSDVQGSESTAQDQILIGMGCLAGCTVMLLTILWGSCIIAHIRNGYSVETDTETKRTARIMILSVLPFVIVQLPLVLQETTQVRLVILISAILSVVLLISYGRCQVLFPWIQSRRLAFVHHNNVISLDVSDERGLGRLLSDDGKPNIEALQKLFKALDSNSDGLLSATELRALILGVQFEEIVLGINEALRNHLKELQPLDGDSQMDMDEFTGFMSKLLLESRRSLLNLKRPGLAVAAMVKFKHKILPIGHKAKLSDHSDGVGGSGHSLTIDSPGTPSRDETVITVKNPGLRTATAALKLLIGALLIAASAYPLVDVIGSISDESGVPSFFVSFVVTPFACYSWIWSALLLAGKKKPRMLSLAFSEIYEVVTVNNVLCFAVFLAIVYYRDFTWQFSSEALAALLVTVVVGLSAGFMKAFSLWTSIVAIVLYPVALALVYLLGYFLDL